MHKSKPQTGMNPYGCGMCHKSFSQIQSLTKHMKTHSVMVKPYCCVICGTYFASTSTLNRHIKVHANGKKFKCEWCGKCFAQKYDLKRHYMTHVNGKGKPAASEDLDFPRDFDAYKDPLEGIHETEELVVIPDSYDLDDMDPLGEADIVEMSEQELVEVDADANIEADVDAYMEGEVEANIGAAHEPDVVVDVDANVEGDLDANIEVNVDANEEVAGDANLEAFHEPDVKADVANVGGDLVDANIGAFEQHGMAQPKPYTCAQCNISFASTSTLNRHIKVHINGKPYQCVMCSKAFAQKYDLNRHHSTHTKCFSCTRCDSIFSSRSDLNRHTKTHCVDKTTFKEHRKTHKNVVEDSKAKEFVIGYVEDEFDNDVEGIEDDDDIKDVEEIGEDNEIVNCDQAEVSYDVSSEVDAQKHVEVVEDDHAEEIVVEEDFEEYTDDDIVVADYVDFDHQTAEDTYQTGETNEETQDWEPSHSDDPNGPLRCNFCGDAGFATISTLNRHMKVHIQGKIHPCDLCHKSFAQRYDLKRHLKTHEKKKSR